MSNEETTGTEGGGAVNVFAQAVEQLVSEGMSEQEATDKVNKVAEAEGAYNLEGVLAAVKALDTDTDAEG